MNSLRIKLGDKRLENRWSLVLQALIDKSHCVVNQLFEKWSDIKGCYRLLSNDCFSEEKLIQYLSDCCKKECVGKSVLALCDTTEYNLNKHRKRINDFTGLGMTSDNKSVGFYVHGILAVDKSSRMPLGWSCPYVYNRPMDNKPFTEPNSSRCISEKESNKWLSPSIKSRDEVFSQADNILFIMDREADIYEVLDKVPNHKADVLIRSKHNRKLVLDRVGEQPRLLHDYVRLQKIKGELTIAIKDNKKRKSRKALLKLRYGKCTISRPPKIKDGIEYNPELEISYVYLKEQETELLEGEKPIEWFLITSKKVENIDQALELAKNYKIRWDIEEMFRLLKKEGFAIESTELETGMAIRKLTLMSMCAAIKIQQLKGARDGQTSIAIEKVFSEEEINCLFHLDKKYKGTTEKQSNPYQPKTLPWASWIIARIGGWKGYRSQRPPGTITYRRGFEKFQTFVEGYRLFHN